MAMESLTNTFSNASTQEIQLPVAGMTCAPCVRRVERAGEGPRCPPGGRQPGDTARHRHLRPAWVDLLWLRAAVESIGDTGLMAEAILPIAGVGCASCGRRVEKARAKWPVVEMAGGLLRPMLATAAMVASSVMVVTNDNRRKLW